MENLTLEIFQSLPEGKLKRGDTLIAGVSKCTFCENWSRENDAQCPHHGMPMAPYGSVYWRGKAGLLFRVMAPPVK